MTQRYDTYKDSGVQWLGEIPGHWGCTRLKYLTSKIGSGSTPTGGSEVYQDSGVLFLRSQNIYNYGLKLEDVAYISEEIHEEMKGTHVKPGDILYNITGGSIGRCCLAPKSLRKANVNQHVSIVRPSNIENNYLLYCLQSEYCQLQMRVLQTGGNREGLSATAFKLFNITIPPLSEQRSIVSFLDDKCGKIDEWVTKKQKEVEHLQELKQRVIADAVTRGLNPHVKMKTTNIPWLKEIPEHWECVKLKMFCQDNKEKNKGNIESCVLSLSYGNIIVKKNVNFGLVPENYESYQIVNPGNIILRLTDLQNDHKSLRTGLVKNRGIITSAYVGLIVKNMNSEYTQLILHSYDVMKVFYGMGGGLRQSMSYTDIANVYIPVPPLSEQRSIVSYLDAKCAKIDKLIANITKEIDCIKEYKQRLISDVVTGQIKVC